MEPVPDLDSAIGALLKRVDPQETMIVVDSYHVSCASDREALDPTAEYAGMVLYALDGKTDWILSGRHCQSGYIYFRKTRDISGYSSSTGQVTMKHSSRYHKGCNHTRSSCCTSASHSVCADVQNTWRSVKMWGNSCHLHQ